MKTGFVLLQLRQDEPGALAQFAPFAGQIEPARVALHQARIQTGFQRSQVAGCSRVGESEFEGCSAEAPACTACCSNPAEQFPALCDSFGRRVVRLNTTLELTLAFDIVPTAETQGREIVSLWATKQPTCSLQIDRLEPTVDIHDATHDPAWAQEGLVWLWALDVFRFCRIDCGQWKIAALALASAFAGLSVWAERHDVKRLTSV